MKLIMSLKLMAKTVTVFLGDYLHTKVLHIITTHGSINVCNTDLNWQNSPSHAMKREENKVYHKHQ